MRASSVNRKREGIRPTVDFAFKRLFGRLGYESLARHFLNALLESNEPAVTELRLLSPQLERQRKEGKHSVVDLLFADQAGRRFNLEVQSSSPKSLTARLLYYLGRILCEQLSAGVQYSQLRPAIGICVLKFPLKPDTGGLHDRYGWMGRDSRKLADLQELHTVDLSKLRTPFHAVARMNAVEQWAYFLKWAHRMTDETIARVLPDPIFRQALEVLNMIQKTPEELWLYEAELKASRDEWMRLEDAHQDGLKRGLALGLDRGIEQGIEQGIELGELIGQVHSAQRLLGELPTPTSELLGLPPEQLRQRGEELMVRLMRSAPTRREAGPT